MTYLEIINYITTERDNMDLAVKYFEMTKQEFINNSPDAAYQMFLADPNGVNKATKEAFVEWMNKKI